MCENDDVYQYITVYVDYLLIDYNDLDVIEDLTNRFKFKFKGTSLIQYHLGMNFITDKIGTLCMKSDTYVDKICT